MSDRIGKCTNYENCSLAYKNEPIRATESFLCPECGQALTEATEEDSKTAPESPAKLLGTIVGILAFAALLVGVFVFVRSIQAPPVVQEPIAEVSPTPAPTPEIPRAIPVETPLAAPMARTPARAIPVARPATGAPNMPVAVPQVPASATSGVREDVLRRIDAMPQLDSKEKDKLYAQVERARTLVKIITIPFESGSTSLSAAQAQQLCAEVAKPQVQKLVHNPTVVFVLLGFADTAGDPAKNLEISRQRAESAQHALRETCRLQNITHPVGMGGSALFGLENRDKNRVAEVWAVLP